jgi:ubiquinone/menaquinone biosynthesis C-methylase UbiE
MGARSMEGGKLDTVTALEQGRRDICANGPEQYERYTVSRLFEPLARVLLERVPLRPGQRVLDVACGTGIVARLAASRVGPSGKVVGLDLDAAMLATARVCAQQEGAAVEWHEGEAGALPFGDASFDAVLCQQGLQFFPDKAGALREMRRVAAPRAMIALAVSGTPGRFVRALSGALHKYAGALASQQCLAPYVLEDWSTFRRIAQEAEIGECEIRTVNLMRRVEPTDEWLLQYTAGLPYAAAIAAMNSGTRAALIRDFAAKLKDLWNGDSFTVPAEVHLVYIRN